MFAVLTLLGFIAAFFLPWYEGPEYYTETYGIDGLFGILISCIRWMTAAFAVLTVILVIIANRVEPKVAKADSSLI